MKKTSNTFQWIAIAVVIIIQFYLISVYVDNTKTLISFNNELNKSVKQLHDEIDSIKISNSDAQRQLQEEISVLKQTDLETKGNLDNIQVLVGSVTDEQESLQKKITALKSSTSSDFSNIIEEEIKGVVTIKTDVGQGSGFIISDDGYIVTNTHVLQGVRYANIITYDQGQYSSELIGYSISKDIALLKIEGNFNSLQLGDSDDVKIGEKVIALGNPFGLSFSVTEGIISARDRTGTNDLPYYFQTDASLNSGNSGGPLINTAGEVIGINNFKISGADNIGFALEIDYAKEIINQIAMQQLNETIV